jgi:hypothetical protein
VSTQCQTSASPIVAGKGFNLVLKGVQSWLVAATQRPQGGFGEQHKRWLMHEHPHRGGCLAVMSSCSCFSGLWVPEQGCPAVLKAQSPAKLLLLLLLLLLLYCLSGCRCSRGP